MLDTIAGATMEVREYQNRLVEKAYGHFTSGVSSVLINSPTGSGKSVIALGLARLLQDRYGFGVGWVAMRRNLLRQAEAMNRGFGINANITYLSMFEKNIPTVDRDGNKIGLLICDEAQHSAVSSMVHVHETIDPMFTLGMSATPWRTDSLRLAFAKTIRDIGIQQLIDLGYLSPYHQYVIPEWSVDEVVSAFLREPGRWGKSAIYWHRRVDAVECADRLRAGGIRAEVVFGDSPNREQRLRDFEDPDGTQVLVNMMVLSEGWDSPGLRTVFVRDSCKLPTIQIAGRVFRKYPGIEFKQVVQSKMTRWPVPRTASPAESFTWLPEVSEWRSYRPSKDIERVIQESYKTLAATPCEMPEYLLKRRKKAGRIEWGSVRPSE